MIVLSATTDNVQVVLSATVTTNQLQCMSVYRDIDATTYTPDKTVVNTNNTTDVNIVPAPASGYRRVVDYISVYNNDTTAKTVTIKFDANGTEYILAKVTLAPGERIEYADGIGFKTLTVDGAVKNTYNQGTNSPITGYSRVILAADVNSSATANAMTDVTGLQVPVTSGQRMWFRFLAWYTAPIATTGSRWSINGPTNSSLVYNSEYTLTATTSTRNICLSGYDLPAASNATSILTTGNIAEVEGIITPTANGNVVLRFASEVVSSLIVAKAGSFVDYGPC